MDRHDITHRQIHAGQAGFTIVEVMVAVVIFAVGLAAIAGMQTRSIQQSTFSDQMSMRVNAVTHWAESLKGVPVRKDSVEIDTGNQIDVEINPLFDEENMCEYGEDYDDDGWSYVDYEDKYPHRLRQRVTQDYPLENLAMVELEATPRGTSSNASKRRTVRVSFLRSTRWN